MNASWIISRISLGLVLFGLGVAPAQTSTGIAETGPGANAETPTPASGKPATDDSRLSRLLKEASLSAGVSEVVELAELGTDVSVLTAHVRNSDHAYRLRPEDVEHLRAHRIPDGVITAMIERGAELRAQRPPSPGVAPAPASVVRIVSAPASSAPGSTLLVIGSSGLNRGLSYRNYYYSPRNFYSSRPYGGLYASFGNYGRPCAGPGFYGRYGDRACR